MMERDRERDSALFEGALLLKNGKTYLLEDGLPILVVTPEEREEVEEVERELAEPVLELPPPAIFSSCSLLSSLFLSWLMGITLV